MLKFRKFRKKYQDYGKTPFLEEIMRKNKLNMPLRILSYFINSDEVLKEDLIKEMFDKVETDKEKLFLQKIALSLQFLILRKNYGVYIKTIPSVKPFCKLMNTKEDFEIFIRKIDDRITNLNIEKEKAEEIKDNIDEYNKKIKELLDTLQEWLRK